MSTEKYQQVLSILRAESQKKNWRFQELTIDEFPNQMIKQGVRLTASHVHWDVFYDPIRLYVLLSNSAQYDLQQDSAACIAERIVRDFNILNSEQIEYLSHT